MCEADSVKWRLVFVKYIICTAILWSKYYSGLFYFFFFFFFPPTFIKKGAMISISNIQDSHMSLKNRNWTLSYVIWKIWILRRFVRPGSKLPKKLPVPASRPELCPASSLLHTSGFALIRICCILHSTVTLLFLFIDHTKYAPSTPPALLLLQPRVKHTKKAIFLTQNIMGLEFVSVVVLKI